MKKLNIWKKLLIWAAFFVNPRHKYITLGKDGVWVKEARIFVSCPSAKNITWGNLESTEWGEKHSKENTALNLNCWKN